MPGDSIIFPPLYRSHVARRLLKFTIVRVSTVPVFANRSQLNGALEDSIVFSRDATHPRVRTRPFMSFAGGKIVGHYRLRTVRSLN